jgi:hypothetical protein
MIDRDQKRRPHILKIDAEGHDYQVLYLTSTLFSCLISMSMFASMNCIYMTSNACDSPCLRES